MLKMMKNTKLMNNNKVLHNGVVKTIDGFTRGHVLFTEDFFIDDDGKEQYGKWVSLDEVDFITLSKLFDAEDFLGFVVEFERFYKSGYINGKLFKRIDDNTIEIDGYYFTLVNNLQNYLNAIS